MFSIRSAYESLNRIYSHSHMVNEADNSWGEKFESIICDAYNCGGDILKSKNNYANDMEKHGMDPAKVYKNIFDSLSDHIKLGKLHKLPNESGSVLNEWKELGLYKDQPNNTPKTDIYCDGGDFRISVKEGSGARLMSGAVNESIATIRSAIKDSDDDDLKRRADVLFKSLVSSRTRDRLSSGKVKVGDIKKKFKSGTFDYDSATEDEKKVYAIQLLVNGLNELVEDINKNNDIKKLIIYEALTGSAKFGKQSKSCANYILTWNKNGSCSLYSVDEYLDTHWDKYKVKAAFKSASVTNAKGEDLGRDIWMVLSIT